MPNFVTRLKQACEANQSLVCVGLDVDPARMPVDDAFEFNKAIIDATGDLVCAYKRIISSSTTGAAAPPHPGPLPLPWGGAAAPRCA